MRPTYRRILGSTMLLGASTFWLGLTACGGAGYAGGEGAAGGDATEDFGAPAAAPEVASTASRAGQPVYDTTSNGRPGKRYIVTIARPGIMNTNQIQDLARDVVERQNKGEVIHVYTRALKGFAAVLADEEAEKLRATGRFSVVEDQWARVFELQPNPPSWGLDRIDQRDPALDTGYNFVDTGDGVHVYVIDTGIRRSHGDFDGNRVVSHIDLLGNDGSDPNGHGTHVAGTVGGRMFGVAKRVQLHAVRVMDESGGGSWSDIIQAIDSIIILNRRPAIINLSLGGRTFEPVDTAVQRAVKAGITVVVAAGNDATDACETSPAREPTAITVGATTRTDDFATDFSNHGSCVVILAPGHDIVSASNADDQQSASMEGTSMAAPHVAGAAALFLQKNPGATPAQVADRLVRTATPDRVRGTPQGTPNRLLFAGS